ncbi:MAG: serine/threonine-protein kinase [Acidimicrobiales bacterium]
MTAEIGRVLGGRYRLVAPIGMGASAQVYLADDVKLRRRVALKMLHDALAGDAEFLRRFRAEARAAAALSHPNIMAVYDWSDGSQEGDVAFIVTEYLPGGSLRSLLDSGALLTPAQALGIGVEAARALDYAHRRGFVHRDVKPANLLFGEDQRLRIADFGLARALAEAAWTEPQGAVLGTARYASPEQAKGERLTGKADVYSLALVLVEAVTGEVPFVADTTLGTLMARVDRQFEAPEALGPLQAVVAAAGNPDPDQRIDARALARGLLRAAQELSRPAPLPLVGALAAGSALAEDLDPTVHAPGPAAAPTDLTSEDLDLDPPAWVNQADPAASAGGAALASAAAVAAVGVGVGAVEAEEVVDLTDDEVDLTDPPSSADEPDEPDDLDGEVSVADAVGLGTPALVGPETEAPAEPVVADGEVLDAPTVGPELDAPTVGAVGAGVPTEAVDAVELGVVAPTLPPVPPPALGGHEPDGPDTHEVEAVGGVDVPTGAAAGGAGGGRRRRKWPWVALAVIVLGGAGGAAAAVATRERPVDGRRSTFRCPSSSGAPRRRLVRSPARRAGRSPSCTSARTTRRRATCST